MCTHIFQPPKLRIPLYSRHIKLKKKSNKDPLFGPNVSGSIVAPFITLLSTRNERTGLQALKVNVSSSSDNQEICVVMQDSVLVPRVPCFVPAFTSDGRAVACLSFRTLWDGE